MQILIEHATINLNAKRGLPEALLAAIQDAGQPLMASIPKIGEKFPGLDALYAGIAPSEGDLPQAHLVLWLARPDGRMQWQPAMDWAEKVHPETSSHAPGKVESALVYAMLRDIGFTEEERRWWHWTSTKRGDDTAFCQYFTDGGQDDFQLSYDGLVRAVSRLPL